MGPRPDNRDQMGPRHDHAHMGPAGPFGHEYVDQPRELVGDDLHKDHKDDHKDQWEDKGHHGEQGKGRKGKHGGCCKVMKVLISVFLALLFIVH